jgi:hypothetical protein
MEIILNYEWRCMKHFEYVLASRFHRQCTQQVLKILIVVVFCQCLPLFLKAPVFVFIV